MRRRFSIDNKNVNYMAIEALEDGLTATINGQLNDYSKIEYSIDGVDWMDMEIGIATSPINCGEKLLFKGNYLGSDYSYINFSISKKCNIKGDIKTLWYGNNARYYNTALNSRSLFENCTNIQEVEDNFLSPTNLTNYCYMNMFNGCSNLTTAPELPATTLASNCYQTMFNGCSNLTTAPELPATTLASNCYSHMFHGCAKLNYIKMLATDISADSCLSYWVYDVSSTGTFVKNKNATWNVTGHSGVPNGWTIQKV